MAGGLGSKIINLTKGIENQTTPQHRTHCTPPHNSRKHGEHPVPQSVLPLIPRLVKLLKPRRDHRANKTRQPIASSLRTQAFFEKPKERSGSHLSIGSVGRAEYLLRGWPEFEFAICGPSQPICQGFDSPNGATYIFIGVRAVEV